MKLRLALVLSFFLFLLVPLTAFARIGVGVGTGKIVVEQKLKPGIIYELPPLTVVNTGDEPSDYAVGISYFQNQKQRMPDESWFIFSPKTFHLDPGKVQIVNIKLNLPVNARPGDYFAYVEGHPVKKTTSGLTTISVAAAAKLYFTVVPANLFQAMYYKAASFWTLYQPWTNWFAIALVVAAFLLVINKFFHIEINLKKKESHSESNRE